MLEMLQINEIAAIRIFEKERTAKVYKYAMVK